MFYYSSSAQKSSPENSSLSPNEMQSPAQLSVKKVPISYLIYENFLFHVHLNLHLQLRYFFCSNKSEACVLHYPFLSNSI